MANQYSLNFGTKTVLDCWATSRGDALLRFILADTGTLEVPLTYRLPKVKFLPSTMPRYPMARDKLYFEGGSHWPDRWLVEVE